MQTYLRNTALLICDLQKKTIPNLYKAKEVINNIFSAGTCEASSKNPKSVF